MGVNPESIRMLMTWRCTPQVAMLVGLPLGQLMNFTVGKFTPTDDQLRLMAEYLVAESGMSIEQQLAKRSNAAAPSIPNTPPNAGVGRPKGVGNNMTRHMRELVYQAAELCGEDGRGKGGMLGYLLMLSKTNMPLFVPLLARLVPQMTHIEADVAVSGTTSINIVPIQRGSFFSPEEVAKMMSNEVDRVMGRSEGQIIEGEAVEVKKADGKT